MKRLFILILFVLSICSSVNSQESASSAVSSANLGKRITVEGQAIEGKLSHLQVAFAEKWGLQCGFCTPGILMSSFALLQSNPDPSREEIRRAIAGNLCRCTGYTPIVNSVQHAVALRKEAENGQ